MLFRLVQASGFKGSSAPPSQDSGPQVGATTHCSSLWLKLADPPLLCGVLPCSQWSRISQYMFLFSWLRWVLTGLTQCSTPCLLSRELSAMPFLHKMRRGQTHCSKSSDGGVWEQFCFCFLVFFPLSSFP